MDKKKKKKKKKKKSGCAFHKIGNGAFSKLVGKKSMKGKR